MSVLSSTGGGAMIPAAYDIAQLLAQLALIIVVARVAGFAAGRVGIAALELGALAGLRLYGTASARDRAKVEALGAVAIDYLNEDFLARMRKGTDGVDVVVDSLGGPISLRSFRALRPGGDAGGWPHRE